MEWEMGRERERRRASDGSRSTLTLAQQTGPFMCRIIMETVEWMEKKALREGWANYEASCRVADREHQKNENEKDRLITLRHELAMESGWERYAVAMGKHRRLLRAIEREENRLLA